MHAHGPALTVLIVVMTLWCAWCTVEAVVHPSIHCLWRLLLMALVMMFVHAGMIIGPQAGSGGHAHHQAADIASSDMAPAAVGSHASATLLIIGIEYLVALVCALSIRRRRTLLARSDIQLLKDTSG